MTFNNFKTNISIVIIYTVITCNAENLYAIHNCSNIFKFSNDFSKKESISKLKDIDQSQILDAKTNSFENGQITYRSLEDYAGMLPDDFAVKISKIRGQSNSHWLDVGSGLSVALVESLFFSPFEARESNSRTSSEFNFYGFNKGLGYSSHTLSKRSINGKHRITGVSFENIPDILDRMGWNNQNLFLNLSEVPEAVSRLKPLMKTAQKSEQFRYLSGRLFEEISDIEIGKVDLISDVYGDFAYNESKIELLIRYCKLLKQGGAIGIVTQFDKVFIRSKNINNARPKYLGDFLEEQEIPRMVVQKGNSQNRNTVIWINNPKQDTIDALQIIADGLHLTEGNSYGGQPIFYYDWIPIQKNNSENE